MNSRCHCVEDIIARCIVAAMKAPGGGISESIRRRTPARFGCKRVPFQPPRKVLSRPITRSCRSRRDQRVGRQRERVPSYWIIDRLRGRFAIRIPLMGEAKPPDRATIEEAFRIMAGICLTGRRSGTTVRMTVTTAMRSSCATFSIFRKFFPDEALPRGRAAARRPLKSRAASSTGDLRMCHSGQLRPDN